MDIISLARRNLASLSLNHPPTVFLCVAVMGIWWYRFRPFHPPHMDTRLFYAESVYPDELDEEFDTFPTTHSGEIVRMRYDRLRSVAGRIQTAVGDLATQGERVQVLLSWRDPQMTFLFRVFCSVAAIGFYTAILGGSGLVGCVCTEATHVQEQAAFSCSKLV